MSELTARQVDVLLLIADGHTDQEIADRLYVGLATVKRHVVDLLNRLGARNRAHAVGIAYRTGVLSDDRDGPVKAIAEYREDT